MASIFISHSSKDKELTVQIEAWLRKLGYDDIFLDLHKSDGISPGMNWKSELAAAMKRSQVILLLISDNWFASVWCQVEYAASVMKGKQIVPVVISPSTKDHWEQLLQALQGKLGDIQFADLTHDWQDGLARLEVVLDRSRVTPLAFDVQPGTAPYKGLSNYTAKDAGLFFARERETQEALEELRQLAAGARTGRLLIVLGASGAGKSSLLRAGLWPQLSLRPREWLSIEPMIPAQNAFLGVTPTLALARAITETFARYDLARSPAEVVQCLESVPLDNRAFCGIADELRTLAGGPRSTLVLAIDQAEELLRTDASEQARFIELLRCFLGTPGCVAVLTIRSDTFDAVQERRLLEEIPFTIYPIAPIPLTRIPEVIRGPASRVGLRVDDLLVDQATEDAKTGDALPLLSFTLERLWRDHGREGDLRSAAYEKLASKEHGTRISPVENTVRLVAEEVVGRLDAADANALSEAFVPGLVDLTDGLEPVRRRASWASMPKRAVPLLKKLQEARLLTSGSKDGGGEAESTLEVAHEALLRRWSMLVERIEAAKPDLRLLQEVERAAADWTRVTVINPEKAKSELRHHGELLARARKLSVRPGWRDRLGQAGTAYIEACVRRKRRQMGLIWVTATFLITTAAVLWLYTRSDMFAIQGMLASSPGVENGYELEPGRAFVVVRAGRRDQAVKEIRRLPEYRQGWEFCQTGLRLLDVGAKVDAKHFISLTLKSKGLTDQTPSRYQPMGSHARITDCLDAAFLVGLGDDAIGVVSAVLPSAVLPGEDLDGTDSPLIYALGEAFVLFSTDKQFEAALSQAGRFGSPGLGLHVLQEWLAVAPSARSELILASLREWRKHHPPPPVKDKDSVDIDSRSVSHDDVRNLVQMLAAKGLYSEADKFLPYGSATETRASLGADEASLSSWRMRQNRLDWLIWSSGETSDQSIKMPQGRCGALMTALLPGAARVLPDPRLAALRLTQNFKTSECGAILAEVNRWIHRPSPQRHEWPDFFSSLRVVDELLSGSYAGEETKRHVYWQMIQELSYSSDLFTYLERRIRDRARYLPPPGEKSEELPDLDSFESSLMIDDSLMLETLLKNSPHAPLPELPSRQEYLRVGYPFLSSACSEAWIGLGRGFLGNASAAREGIERAKKVTSDLKSEFPLYDDVSIGEACISIALATIRDYDAAESTASDIEDTQHRDHLLRALVILQAGHGDFMRARNTARKISTRTGQRGAETEVLMIWSEAQAGS